MTLLGCVIALVIAVIGSLLFGGALLCFRSIHWYSQLGAAMMMVSAVAIAVAFAYFLSALIGLSRL